MPWKAVKFNSLWFPLRAFGKNDGWKNELVFIFRTDFFSFQRSFIQKAGKTDGKKRPQMQSAQMEQMLGDNLRF